MNKAGKVQIEPGKPRSRTKKSDDLKTGAGRSKKPAVHPTVSKTPSMTDSAAGVITTAHDTIFNQVLKGLPPDMAPPEPGTPRSRIVDAARKLFSEKGIDGVGTREIADLAGVNQAMIHYYFGSKEGLYRKVLTFEVIKMFRLFAEIYFRSRSPEEFFPTLPVKMIEALRANTELVPMIRRELASGGKYFIGVIHELGNNGPRGLRIIFESILQTGVKSGKLRKLPESTLQPMLIGIAYGILFIQPFISEIIDHTLEDEEYWKDLSTTITTVLSHGLLREK